MKRAAILAAILLSGCVSAQTEMIYLEAAGKPAVTCGPYPTERIYEDGALRADAKLRSCVSDFQRQGYQRVAPPAK